MNEGFKVAIDGPAGSGKSSVARALSKRFELVHFDSGACYRAVAYYFWSEGVTDPEAVDRKDLSSLIRLTYTKGLLFLNEKQVGDEIRTPVVSRYTSDISTKKQIRDFVTASIRDMIKGNDEIIEGRDIGSVVMTDADLKIFLTATPRERAKRRLKEWQKNGEQINLDEVIKEIELRDQQDTNRILAPLKPAEDAILLDTTSLSFHEVVEKISGLIHQKKGDSGFYTKS